MQVPTSYFLRLTESKGTLFQPYANVAVHIAKSRGTRPDRLKCSVFATQGPVVPLHDGSVSKTQEGSAFDVKDRATYPHFEAKVELRVSWEHIDEEAGPSIRSLVAANVQEMANRERGAMDEAKGRTGLVYLWLWSSRTS